jgi:hypothetical protein
MILTFSFSPKIQICTDTPKNFSLLLNSYAKIFDELNKIKNLDKVWDDPNHHEWEIETSDRNLIKKLKKLGCQKKEEID